MRAFLSVLGRIVIVEAFLKWAKTARSSDRAKAASALARAYLQSRLGDEQSDHALMSLTHLVHDPSPLVRSALAKELGLSPKAPRHILLALANDQPDVAAEIILNCKILSDDDLIEIAACGSDVTQALIAMRDNLSAGLCAALCEIAESSTLLVLLENETAALYPLHYNRIAQRFGDVADIRAELLARPDLLPQAQHLLLRSVTTDIGHSDFLAACVGQDRLSQLVDSACEDALVSLIEHAPDHCLGEIIDRLIADSHLSVSLLIKLSVVGQGEFLVRTLSLLADIEVSKTRKMIANGREASLMALFKSAGLPSAVGSVLCTVTLYWRSATYGDHLSSILTRLREVPPHMPGGDSHFALIALIDRFANMRRFDQAEVEVMALTRRAA